MNKLYSSIGKYEYDIFFSLFHVICYYNFPVARPDTKSLDQIQLQFKSIE